jgi:hypothetical protein
MINKPFAKSVPAVKAGVRRRPARADESVGESGRGAASQTTAPAIVFLKGRKQVKLQQNHRRQAEKWKMNAR